MKCMGCEKELDRDEIGLSCKMISRTGKSLYCLDCLGKMFHLTRAQLLELIEHFRAAGCTLFQ